MDNDNRINNNNPRRDISRPDRSNMERMGRVTNQNRPSKSEFQKVLEQSHNNFDPYQGGSQSMSTTVTKEAIQPAASMQERFGKDKEGFKKHLEKEDPKDDVKKSDSKESVGPRAKLAEKKVVSRSAVSDHSGHSDQGQQKSDRQSGQGGHQASSGGTSQQGKKGRDLASPLLTKNSKTLRQAGGSEVRSFQADLHATQISSLVSKPSLTGMGKVLSQVVMNQIIQYCRLVTKTDGDKEIDMQLKEEIFKGLRLKVSMARGGIEAIFMAPSQEVLDLFQAQKSEIQKALQEKGIEVRSLRVILS